MSMALPTGILGATSEKASIDKHTKAKMESGRLATFQEENTPRVSHRKAKVTNVPVYLNHANLIGAAEAMSTGISSALQTLSVGLRSFQESDSNANQKVLSQESRVSPKDISDSERRVSSKDISDWYSQEIEEKKGESLVEDDNLTITAGTQRVKPVVDEFLTSSETSSSSPIAMQLSEVSSSSAASSNQEPISNNSRHRKTSRNAKCADILPSPMARMRCFDTQQAIETDEGKTPSSTPVRKTHEEMKIEKQRNWKRKMKLAQKKKAQERKNLDRDFGSLDLDGNGFVHFVQNNVYNLMQMKCGDIEDILASDSEYSAEEDSGDEDPGDEDQDVMGTESASSDSSSRRPKKNARSRLRTKGSRTAESMNPDTPFQKQRERPKGTPRRQRSRDRTLQGTPESGDISAESDLSGSIVSPGAKPPLSPQSTAAHFHPKSPSATMDLDLPHFSQRVPQEDAERHSEVSTPCSRTSDATGPSAAMDPNSKNFIKAFIHDLVSLGCLMLWHKENSSMNPSTINLRLKLGYRTPSGSYCGPRIVWAGSKPTEERYGINLFDIKSLERASHVHLKDYPFAIPGRSIFLKFTHGQDFVFEAKSEQEALRFVHGMRWVIARFSFNLVIGNMNVACELLNIDLKADAGTKSPPSLLEEAKRARAMDDVTSQLVDKSVFHAQNIHPRTSYCRDMPTPN